MNKLPSVELSIVIPTYNEADNIKPLVHQLNNLLNKYDYEIIFIDDSDDNTVDKIKNEIKNNKCISYEHRIEKSGLASAVVRGFELSTGKYIAVMDADLQHPPEIVLNMLTTIKETDVDIVLPSRFIKEGNDGGLSLKRKLISFTARIIARMFIKSLRNISDPTSGIFLFKKEILNKKKLRPTGWKILMEILVICEYKNNIEIPYKFNARNAGSSKMNYKEQLNYLLHIISLLKRSPDDRRFFFFMIIGFSGVIINLIIYYFLIQFMHIPVFIAGLLAASTAVMSNFLLNDRYTWPGIKNTLKHKRLLKYIIVSIIGILTTTLILSGLYYLLNINYIYSNLLGIIVASLLTYKINNVWTWRPRTITNYND